MSQDKPWLDSYPEGVPHQVDYSQYESLNHMFEDSFDLYAFLSNNTVVARIAIATNSPKREMYAAAVATGMSLLKVPPSQNLLLGFSYNWDGTSFSEIA